MRDVVVVGAGIAGLTAAVELQGRGLDVLVLEAEQEPGGNIRTLARGEFRMERGPHSFMGSAEHVWRLVELLGLQEHVEAASAASANRYILRGRALHALPLSPGSFLRSRLLSARGKLRLAAEPFVPRGGAPDETAWDFFRRRFGEEAAAWIMSPFISGIYAGDIHALGARHAFQKFWSFEQESGSMIRGAMRFMRAKRRRLAAEGLALRRGLFSMHRGLGLLTETATARLHDRILSSASVRSVAAGPRGLVVKHGDYVEEARSVVLAIPPHQAARLLDKAAPPAAALLDGIPLVPLAVVHWSPRRGDQAPWPEGFGALIPRQEGLRLLGTLFPSQLFDARAPHGRHLFTSYFGGALDPEASKLPDGALAELVRREHRVVFGFDPGELDTVMVVRYEHAIPQLLPGHLEKVESARAAATAALPGLIFAGNWLSGVGIENAVESGFAAASLAAGALRPGSP